MIFNDMQLTLQSDFQEVETQIQALQLQQKQILDKIQSVGSVESEIESALAMLAKGLSHAKEVCPDQIDRVKRINLDLYMDKNPQLVEQIEGTLEGEPADEPDPVSPNPTDEEFDDTAISAVTVTSEEIEEALGGEPEIRIIPKSVEETEEDDAFLDWTQGKKSASETLKNLKEVEEQQEEQQEVEQQQEVEDAIADRVKDTTEDDYLTKVVGNDQLESLSYKKLQKLCQRLCEPAKGAKWKLVNRLQGKVTMFQLEQLPA